MRPVAKLTDAEAAAELDRRLHRMTVESKKRERRLWALVRRVMPTKYDMLRWQDREDARRNRKYDAAALATCPNHPRITEVDRETHTRHACPGCDMLVFVRRVD